MTGVPVSPPVLVIGVSLCCAIALVALAHGRTAGQRASLQWAVRANGIAAGGCWPIILVALWLGADALVASFAILSTAWLATFLAAQRTSAGDEPLRTACCLLCVPLQYALVVTGRYDLFATVVPLLTVIALPLWSLAQGERRSLVERVAERHWGVMAFVYCASHVPALLMLEPALPESGLMSAVTFLALVAVTTQCSYAIMLRAGGMRNVVREATLVAMPIGLGIALSVTTPFPPLVAAALASVATLSGWIGCRVLACVRHDGRRAPAAGQSLVVAALRPDALVFAAPPFFYAMRAWLLFA